MWVPDKMVEYYKAALAVDDILATAHQAGARITRPGAPTFYGGYAGVFIDPDGHPWEIAFNPGFSMAADGSVLLPDFGAPSST